MRPIPEVAGPALLLVSLAAAALLAAVHVFSPQLRVLDGVPRNRVLSAVGGMAVAFIILRLLLAIAAHQETLDRVTLGTVLGALSNHVYIVLLVSLVLFFGMERLARSSQGVIPPLLADVRSGARRRVPVSAWG